MANPTVFARKRQKQKPTCDCEPYGGLKCSFHKATHKPKSLGTFTIDSDDDKPSASFSQARAEVSSAEMNTTPSKPYLAPYVEDAAATPDRDVMPGQKRKRRDLWDQTGNVKSSTTASMSKEVQLASPRPFALHTSPKIEQETSSAVSGRAIRTPVQDDCIEAPPSPGATRSYTVEAAPFEQSTPTKANVNATLSNHDAVQNPSKLARLVMHAFDINQHAFVNAELRRLLRLYKGAISRGDRQDESLHYRNFFLHLWMHVGASRERFDLEALISGICTYQEMAMTDVVVSRRINEIQMDMVNENQDGVKDRAGELWAYV
ncbi:hypothetical protein MBLNU457_3192t1 [Dothideomycetes sp. NU457]